MIPYQYCKIELYSNSIRRSSIAMTSESMGNLGNVEQITPARQSTGSVANRAAHLGGGHSTLV
ncbi:uncharacterized protein N7498_003319 [Penicillium cinerascens]|uniref:Uncharacterized protein n=1 Tax=Penicillium cinerascens TaxID=70096 RepID=A0A9W9N2W0_9EURO|nr:uncharacterized protein N7498_003319 [Penicillium cinerascens]KAJ5211673.1 hypothetical protein N7498_003319 [Penicillium cinerascens]